MDTENMPLTIRYTYNKLVRDKIPENIDHILSGNLFNL